MKIHTKVALSLLALGLVALVGYRVAEPYLKDRALTDLSDAASLKGRITVAMDGWAGYFPLCSPEIKRRLRREGYALTCRDDQADYAARFEQLDKGEIDFAVATVDSFVLNGRDTQYPGAIVAVIDESKGGDAIVAKRDVVASLEDLKTRPGINIAFTPNSPSHHLMKSVAAHFDIPVLIDDGAHQAADGSTDALRALKSGRADVAVLWEPEVSKALADDDVVRLLGTEDTQGLIVDILIASRASLRAQPDMVDTFLNVYFQTLKAYTDNPDSLIRDLAEEVDLDRDTVATLVKGVAWANLTDNAERWFGVGVQGNTELVTAIDSAIAVLKQAGDVSASPLPQGDAYRLVNSQFVDTLYRAYGSGELAGGATPSATALPELSDAQWDQLREVGALKARRVVFAPSSATLTDEGQRVIDDWMQDLAHYPRFRLEVRGHTATRGDAEINRRLSFERAEAVAGYLNRRHGVETNRVRAQGFGGSRPLTRGSNESQRAYAYRLPRVELVLVREVL